MYGNVRDDDSPFREKKHRAHLPEGSKGPALGAGIFECVGSNPTVCTLLHHFTLRSVFCLLSFCNNPKWGKRSQWICFIASWWVKMMGWNDLNAERETEHEEEGKEVDGWFVICEWWLQTTLTLKNRKTNLLFLGNSPPHVLDNSGDFIPKWGKVSQYYLEYFASNLYQIETLGSFFALSKNFITVVCCTRIERTQKGKTRVFGKTRKCIPCLITSYYFLLFFILYLYEYVLLKKYHLTQH